MRLQIAIITLLFSSFVKASCEAESCNTIVEFSTSYVQAVLEKDELKLEKHFYDERYTCFLDKLEFKARYTGHEIVEDKLLDGDNLEHFMLTVRSEATKIQLYYELKESNPDLDHREIMRMVFKELTSPNLDRVDVPMPIKPTRQVRLRIFGEMYHSDHPCFVYSGTSDNLYLVTTEHGFRAVEPLCDIGRAVGRRRIDTDYNQEEGDRIFESLSLSQVEEYKELLKSGRISTVKALAGNLAVNYADAKYVVYDKICPLIP